MLRAKDIFLHDKVLPALADAKGIPFLEDDLDRLALRTGATGSRRASRQPVYFPQVLILSKPEENVNRWRDKFQLLFF